MKKAVILAGGYGTRLAEETDIIPKPMIEIGGHPILWHIMRMYSAHGINEFIICLGYKGHIIKEFFSSYHLRRSDVTFDLTQNRAVFHRNDIEPWTVTLVDTGVETMTGGRLKRIRDYLDGSAFCMTYGDAVSSVDIRALIAFHESHGRAATVTAVRPPARFGALNITGDSVRHFEEKPQTGGDWINGGFFVLTAETLDLVNDDQTVWEKQPLELLAARGDLMAYKHDGFWQPMDTLRDKRVLESIWASGAPPWMIP